MLVMLPSFLIGEPSFCLFKHEPSKIFKLKIFLISLHWTIFDKVLIFWSILWLKWPLQAIAERKTWNFSHQNGALPMIFFGSIKKARISRIFRHWLLEMRPCRIELFDQKLEPIRAEPRLGSNTTIYHSGLFKKEAIIILGDHDQVSPSVAWATYSPRFPRGKKSESVHMSIAIHCLDTPFKFNCTAFKKRFSNP